MTLFGVDGEYDRMRIRALRALPPGRAGATDRRPVFGAALEQFDELLTAASAIGPAARPLPLYYALNQAGRAIIAARQDPGKEWQPKAHGLSIGDPDDHGNLQGTPIKPQKNGAFVLLADALDTGGLTMPTLLQNVWAAIPLLPSPGLGAGCSRPLLVETPGGPVARHLTVRFDFVPATGGAADGSVHRFLSETYPRAADGLAVNHSRPGDGGGGVGGLANVTWNRSDSVPWHRATAMKYLGDDYYLVPGLNEARDVLHRPILLWWCLLQALSSLARYHSAEWAAALQPDNSRWCVAIERALSMALEIVPRLIFEELTWLHPGASV